MKKSKKRFFQPVKRVIHSWGSAWRGFVKQIKTAVVGGVIVWAIFELVKAL